MFERHLALVMLLWVDGGPFTGSVVRLKLHREEIFSLPFYTTSETTLRRLLYQLVPSLLRTPMLAILTHPHSFHLVLLA